MEREARKWNEVKDILVHTTAYAPKNLNIKILQDTLIQLYWSNVAPEQDTIFIERSITNGEYARIDTLPGDSATYCDSVPVRQAYNHYRVIARLNSGTDLYSQPVRIMMPAYEPRIRTPYLGEPALIPGTVEAEDYDAGGEGFTYHDSDPLNLTGDYRPGEGVDIYSRPGGGYHIGNALPGEWYEYSVHVENEGFYKADFQLAAIEGGGKFTVTVGDIESGTLSALASGSWLTTGVASDTLNLAAGEQIMRFTVISQPIFNIDRFVFTPLSPQSGIRTNRDLSLTVYLDRNHNIVVDIPDETRVHRIDLYSMTGSLLYSGLVEHAGHRIPAGRMPPGLYILKAVTLDSRCTLKIILP